MYRIWFERTLPPAYAHLLNGVAEALGPASATPETPLVALPRAQAIIAAARIQYNGAVMDQAPELRVIARMGIGVDNVDLDAATARKIAVCNVPDGPTISTAEHTVMLILATVKQLPRMNHVWGSGRQIDFFNAYDGLEVCGLCLGLIGLGRIGAYVARVASALGMRVVGYDPYISAEKATELGVECAPTLEAVFDVADIVSLHLPLTPATRHLVNAARLAQMKPGAYLINTARGGLVDEAALLDALEQGRLHGAGLDVVDPEPPEPDNPLLNRADVIVTPHIGGVTTASRQRLWQMAIMQALQVLRGERPPHLLNPEVWLHS